MRDQHNRSVKYPKRLPGPLTVGNQSDNAEKLLLTARTHDDPAFSAHQHGGPGVFVGHHSRDVRDLEELFPGDLLISE